MSHTDSRQTHLQRLLDKLRGRRAVEETPLDGSQPESRDAGSHALEAPVALAGDPAPVLLVHEPPVDTRDDLGVSDIDFQLPPESTGPAWAEPETNILPPSVAAPASHAATRPALEASEPIVPRPRRRKPIAAQPSFDEAGDDAQQFLPGTIVTGSIPYISGAPDEIAWHDAALACSTEKLRITYSLHDGRVWYIAAPAAEFAGNGGALNPLADALPGMPGHRGDGGYQAESLSRTVTVFRAGNSLKTIVGDHQVVELYRADHGEPEVHKASASAPWVARDIRNASLDRVLFNRVNAYAWATAVIAAILATISVGVANALSTRIADTERQQMEVTREVLKTVQALQVQPLRTKMTEIRSMYAKVVQNQGIIQAIKLEKGLITAKIELPSWVPDSEVTALAAGGTVTATAQSKTITRGKPQS